MTSKKGAVRLIIVVGLIICLTLLLFVFRSYIPIYLPNSQKEFKVTIKENNNEPAIFVGISLDQKEKLIVELYDSDGNLCQVSKTLNGENSYKYNYLSIKPGQTYTVKIKNKTNSIIFSNGSIQNNN